jgi:hypothetical protein
MEPTGRSSESVLPAAFAVLLTVNRIESPLPAPVPARVYSINPRADALARVICGTGFDTGLDVCDESAGTTASSRMGAND